MAAVAIALVIVRLFGGDFGARVDTTVVTLLGAAVLVLLVPWERLESFRGGGIEITIDRPEVKAAIEGLDFGEEGRLKNERLLERLERLRPELSRARRSRVLWIDDNPHEVLGVRRVLRSLGINIVTATSSERAEEILEADNDFDLVISDVQRIGESYLYNDGRKVHEGVNFICKLRDHEDPNIRSVQVLFYAAYDWPRLVKFTRPARELQPEAAIANEAEDLITKAIRILAEVRADPIEYKVEKPTTPYERGPRHDGEREGNHSAVES